MRRLAAGELSFNTSLMVPSVMRTAFVILAGVLACGCTKKGADTSGAPASKPADDSATEAPTPPPEPALSKDDCKTILAGVLASAKPDGPPRPKPEAVLATAIHAEPVPLRGEPATVCISWRERETCDEPLDEGECLESSGDALYVIATVDPVKRTVVDKQVHASSRAPTESDDQLSWEVVAVGPSRDALVLTSSSESGDSSVAEVSWLAVSGGKLVEIISYRHGTEDGDEIGTVKHAVTSDASGGYFNIRFEVQKGGETRSDTCSWDASASGYACQADLLDDL